MCPRSGHARPKAEPPRGSGGMLPQKILKLHSLRLQFRVFSENVLAVFGSSEACLRVRLLELSDKEGARKDRFGCLTKLQGVSGRLGNTAGYAPVQGVRG